MTVRGLMARRSPDPAPWLIPVDVLGEVWLVRVGPTGSGALWRVTTPTPGRACRVNMTGPFDLLISPGEFERLAYRPDREGD